MKKKTYYKFISRGNPVCSCCKLEYWKGSVLNGFTIALTKKETGKDVTYIDIPLSEIKNLIKVAKAVLKEDRNEKKEVG